MIKQIAAVTLTTVGAIVCSALAFAAFSLISSSLATQVLAAALVLATAYAASVWREKQLAEGPSEPKADESVWENLQNALLAVGCNAVAATILANSAVIPSVVGFLSPVILGLAGFISWIFPLLITYFLIKMGLALLWQSAACLRSLCGLG